MRRNTDFSGVFLFIMETNNEIWKDVPGYEGLYQCSNLGRVVSTKQGRKILKLQINKYGYTNVLLHTKYKTEAFAIHKLVAITFLGFEKSQKASLVKHKDLDMKNNRVDNLIIKENKAGNKKDGVTKDQKTGIFVATIIIEGKTIYREEFQTKQSANKAYRQNILKFISELSQKSEESFSKDKKLNKTKSYGFDR